MKDSGIISYHRSCFSLGAALLPLMVLILLESKFSTFSLALLVIALVFTASNLLYWKFIPKRSMLPVLIIFNSAQPSLCLLFYSALVHDWCAGLQHPLLLLYLVFLSFTHFLGDRGMIYLASAVSISGYLGLLAFSSFTGRIKLGAAYLGAWGHDYIDVATPLFITALLLIYSFMIGREIKTAEESSLERGLIRRGQMSPREEEIARLISEGLEYKEIAGQLGLSLSTVKNHVKKIYIKLGARNKVELINSLNENSN